MKNILTFIVGVVVAAWALHDLLAPGEEPSTGTLAMTILMFLFGCAAAIGAIILMVRARAPKT